MEGCNQAHEVAELANAILPDGEGDRSAHCRRSWNHDRLFARAAAMQTLGSSFPTLSTRGSTGRWHGPWVIDEHADQLRQQDRRWRRAAIPPPMPLQARTR